MEVKCFSQSCLRLGGFLWLNIFTLLDNFFNLARWCVHKSRRSFESCWLFSSYTVVSRRKTTFPPLGGIFSLFWSNHACSTKIVKAPTLRKSNHLHNPCSTELLRLYRLLKCVKLRRRRSLWLFCQLRNSDYFLNPPVDLSQNGSE